MTTLLKNRKALSPLIATILLIAFAVALGAVVMNIGRTTVLGPDSSSIFSILEIAGKKQVCYFERGSSSLLQFTVKNGGTDEIADFQISFIGTKDIASAGKILAQPVKQDEVKKIAVSYDSTVIGQLKKIIITPVVMTSGQPNLESAVEIDSVPTCQP